MSKTELHIRLYACFALAVMILAAGCSGPRTAPSDSISLRPSLTHNTIDYDAIAVSQTPAFVIYHDDGWRNEVLVRGIVLAVWADGYCYAANWGDPSYDRRHGVMDTGL